MRAHGARMSAAGSSADEARPAVRALRRLLNRRLKARTPPRRVRARCLRATAHPYYYALAAAAAR